jgi:hypothetical protein
VINIYTTYIDKYCIFGYYIKIEKANENRIISQDSRIAELLDISLEEYQVKLLHYNAECKSIGTRQEMYFQNKEDANKALEWINSLLVVKQLTNYA